MKRALISLLAVIALVALAIGYRSQFYSRALAKTESATTTERQPQRSLSPEQNGRVRVIYAIVGQDGVYFGEQRVDFGIAISLLEEIAKKEGVHNVSVHVTDLARYGDAVRFYTGIDRSKFYVTSFPTRPVTIGYRLPLIGIFRMLGCCWVDEANSEELS